MDKESLDKDYIINNIFKTLTDSKMLHDNEFDTVKFFLTKLKAQIYELKNLFSLDFLGEKSSNKYMSSIVFEK